MIEILPQSTDNCLVVRLGGRVSGPEYQQFAETIRARLSVTGWLNLVVDLSDFEFYGDRESAQEDFSFGLHEYNQISRAAYLGDQKWIEWFVKLIGPFTNTEERHFTPGQLSEAFEWASAG